jgi:hypothetical protein
MKHPKPKATGANEGEKTNLFVFSTCNSSHMWIPPHVVKLHVMRFHLEIKWTSYRYDKIILSHSSKFFKTFFAPQTTIHTPTHWHFNVFVL